MQSTRALLLEDVGTPPRLRPMPWRDPRGGEDRRPGDRSARAARGVPLAVGQRIVWAVCASYGIGRQSFGDAVVTAGSRAWLRTSVRPDSAEPGAVLPPRSPQ
ncbi:MAG: hypothetical protein R3F56_22835 [Planctomycetota bacterium]